MEKDLTKILLVEDELDTCDALKSFLGRRGFNLITTPSGLKALSLIKEIKPCMVLLDITIDDIDGIEVLKRLRKTDKQTKVILVTGQVYNEEETAGIYKLGIEGLFNKPVSLMRLSELINRSLGSEVTVGIPTVNRPVTKTVESEPKTHHKISNLLGIVRNKCENYVLDIKDGVYRDKSDADRVNIATSIMSDAMKKVDEISKLLEDLRK